MSEDFGRQADRIAITDLLVDYCRYLDRMELDALAALFTEDCHVNYGADPRLAAEGRSVLARSLARMWRWKRTAHHVSNMRIWFEGADTAHSECYVMAWHEAQDFSTAIVYGRYLDRFMRTTEGWRIKERLMDMNGADSGFRVPVPQAPRRQPPSDWTPPKDLDR